ncbi:MAG: aldehyde ferredoxin oxidoreductase C-terminal domain-containing protein, partial [Thermodesulfobacteriota bacterium]|nr:aldehyde ferredoxin oxidoreductase C-terminal domain-containing protein [Thermodesulfobacteriota bacterium]
ATATRGADHLRSRPAIDLYHLPENVLGEIYGREGMTSDYRDYQGKPWMIFWHECLYALVDALGICKFQTVFLSPNMPKWEEYGRLLTIITGLKYTPEQLREVGERIYNIERLFNIREGASRADDTLPERFFKEPTPMGLEAVRNRIIDQEKFNKMLDEYYEIHGWDKEGKPTEETLKRLGLDREPEHLL